MNLIETSDGRRSDPTGLDDRPLATATEVAERFNISMATFWRRVADGTLPKPIKIGGLSRWSRAELDAVIATAKASRIP